MNRCEDIHELAQKGEFHGGMCYQGPPGLEWLFPTIFVVCVLLVVATWFIPATAPAMFRRKD